jgi:hypothetical protein
MGRTLPSARDLRAASIWVWVALALAVASVFVHLVQAGDIDATNVANAVISAGPFVFVAALVYAAPRERLVRISALGFAVAPTIALVRLFFGGRYLLPMLPSESYAGFAAFMADLTGNLHQIDWLVTAGAILVLAQFMGGVRSRAGWAIVGLGVLIASASILVNFAQRQPPEIEPVEQFAVGIFAQLVVVAWAYLLAAAFEHRLRLISAAVTIRLALQVFGLPLTIWLTSNPGPDAYDAIQVIQPWVSAVYLVANASFWVLLIGGALREIHPRSSARPDGSPDSFELTSQEAHAAGR